MFQFLCITSHDLNHILSNVVPNESKENTVFKNADWGIIGYKTWKWENIGIGKKTKNVWESNKYLLLDCWYFVSFICLKNLVRYFKCLNMYNLGLHILYYFSHNGKHFINGSIYVHNKHRVKINDKCLGCK